MLLLYWPKKKSGVIYYNENGEEQDVFKTLAESGINYICIRVWNDPYDENGNGYGGGNNDIATAIELGKRATLYGMKVCIDFHYSDFRADPAKQMCPKAWEGMTIEEKSDALYTFTKESLSSMLDAGVNVSMVQVGNETNNGMAGETSYKDMAVLMNAGSRAIREVSENYEQDIQIALHFTDASDYDGIDRIMQKLEKYKVDYDILTLSYYPYWHGSFDNLKNVMENIKTNYGKETLVAETSYCYTLEDGDGFANSVGEADLIKEYAATVQSQATAIDTSTGGSYVIDGTLENKTAVTCNVTIDYLNYVKNPSFEDDDRTMWVVDATGSNPTVFQEKEADANSGNFSFHFWSESDMDFSMEQTITDLPNGTYKYFAYAQGGDVDDTAFMELYAIAGGEEKTVFLW